MDVFAEIKKRKIIAIVRGLPSSQMTGLVRALLTGGISLVEVTFAQNKPDTWADTEAAIAGIAREFPDQVIPGAGTVVSLQQLEMAHRAGAKYIISPNMNPEIIRRTKALGLVSLPGAMTPTEIQAAHEAGADAVKVFPMGSLGPDYIKAVKAPLSHISLMAVGGVNEKNAAAYLAAGAEGLGVGGNLVNKQWIEAGDFDKITDLARQYVLAAGI